MGERRARGSQTPYKIISCRHCVLLERLARISPSIVIIFIYPGRISTVGNTKGRQSKSTIRRVRRRARKRERKRQALRRFFPRRASDLGDVRRGLEEWRTAVVVMRSPRGQVNPHLNTRPLECGKNRPCARARSCVWSFGCAARVSSRRNSRKVAQS